MMLHIERMVTKSSLTVIFFGADASGKTTQVKMLTKYLKNKGFRVRRVWIRAHHSFAFLILKLFFRADIDQDPFLKGTTLGAQLGKSRLWIALETSSVLPWIFLRFYMPRSLGYTVVCDRYLPDTLVSLAYTYNDESLMRRFPGDLLIRFIPRDALFIHLTGDVLSLKNRSKEGDLVKNSLAFQIRQYNTFAHALEAKTIDTSLLDKEQAFAEVIALVKQKSAF